MPKKLPYTFQENLGFGGKKKDEEKAIKTLQRVGIDAISGSDETPLVISAYLGNVKILKLIIESFKTYYPDNSETFGIALSSACSHRRLECIKILVEEGANIEQIVSHKMTPLAKAFTNTFSDPIPTAEYLISKGARTTDRFIEMGMSWDSEKFVAFLEKQNIEFDPKLIPKKEIVDVEQIDTTIDIDKLHNIINDKDYDKTNKVIWKKLVPSSGQADTVQGELLRAVEKLRDEAQRNGNGNFAKNCHGLLVKYLKEHLADKTIFDKETVTEIKRSIKLMSRSTMPYIEDDIYDYISNRIVDWYLKNPTQIPHIKNETLYC